MKTTAAFGVVMLVVSCAVYAKTGPEARPAVSAGVDQTAIWVGDVLRYTVRAVHVPDVELVLDNFKKDLLPLAPFTIRDIQIRRGGWADGKKSAEIVLLLSSLETGKTELTIPPVQLYYFVREPGLAGKESPVESVTVPALKIGLRSTLVPARPAPREARTWAANGFGLPLLLLGLGGAGLLALAGYGGRRIWKRLHPDQVSGQLTRQQRERIVHDGLARVRAAVEAAGDDARRTGGAIALELRRVIEGVFQIPASALTPEEIEVELARARIDATLIGEIKTVLAECEELHYGNGDAAAGKGAKSERRPRKQLAQAAEKIMQSPQLLSA